MEEININLVGNDEEIQNEEIFNDFDFNYIPINNLPISYFPLNNNLLLNDLKKNNSEDLTGGNDITTELSNNTTLEITSQYKILVKKTITCQLKMNNTDTSFENIKLNKGVYTILYNYNDNNIILKNNKELRKIKKVATSTSITLTFNENDITQKNIKKLSFENQSTISSISQYIEPTKDNPDYKLLVFRTSGTLKLNKDILCDVLLVGGGGYGGWLGGGGGGGGVVEKYNYLLKSGDYNINIGDGGNTQNGYKGINTTIEKNGTPLLGAGGGGNGGDGNLYEGNMGNIITFENSETNQGGKGGNGYKMEIGGGGGDGAGGKGINGTKDKAGNGGIGKMSKITGKEEYYGGGGGGAGYKKVTISGEGGNGGGGNGGIDNIKVGVYGETNKGGGGGGLGIKTNEEGFGGSGIVIFRVKREDIEAKIDDNDLLIDYDTRIINEINNELNKKIVEFNNNEKPYNYLGIYPLVILIILIWIFIFLFLLKFIHHYFANIYLYILLSIIILLLLFGSIWFLYTNNDLL
jgi:hypothetical protein